MQIYLCWQQNTQASSAKRGTEIGARKNTDNMSTMKTQSQDKATARPTKAQTKRVNSLEGRGYDFSHTADNGNPVLALREKRIWVEVLRNGNYQPA